MAGSVGQISNEESPRERHEHADTASEASKGGTRQVALTRRAQGILIRRQARTTEFGRELFGEPAWEMLLELYVREGSGVSSTTAQIKICLRISASTTARWLDHLEQAGFIMRMAHPLQQGTEFIELTEKARRSLDRYLETASPDGAS